MGLLNASQRSYYEGADGVQNSGDENYGNYQFTSLKDIINDTQNDTQNDIDRKDN